MKNIYSGTSEDSRGFPNLVNWQNFLQKLEMANILSNLRLPRQCFWSEVTLIYLLRHYLDCLVLISLAFLTYILQLVLILKNLALAHY